MVQLKALALCALVFGLSGCASAAAPSAPLEQIALSQCRPSGFEEDVLCGVFSVPENRAVQNGRMLPLRIIVLPARQRTDAGPVFFLSGGPGQAATDSAANMVNSWARENSDVVYVDMRGTGEGHRLDCLSGATDDNLQSYLEPAIFSNHEMYAACRDELAANADLTQYTTEIAMRDLDEARRALGYDRINLWGGSYGTRAGLTYIRRYGENVRTAYLTGLAPFEHRNPLYHAPSAQRSFDRVADQCAADAACHAAFPDVRGDLAAIMSALRASPARVTVTHPATGTPVEIALTAQGFADGLRAMLYRASSARAVPYLLNRARQGEASPFAEIAVRSSRGVVQGLRLGLLLSVVCAEDIPRILRDEISAVTGASFIGEARVRNQMGVCAIWPRGEVPADFAAHYSSNVPGLLVSGDIDPVTPPEFGEIAQRYLPNALHVVGPEGHAEGGECVQAMARTLFRTGGTSEIDTNCAANITLPPFALTAADYEEVRRRPR